MLIEDFCILLVKFLFLVFIPVGSLINTEDLSVVVQIKKVAPSKK